MATPQIAQVRQTRHFHTGNGYQIGEHPTHNRLYHINLNGQVLNDFFKAFNHIDSQNLAYIPYMRLILAKELDQLFGADFKYSIRAILHDRDSGGFTIGVNGVTSEHQDYIKFGTAISHLIGPGNFDAMSGTYYARFLVKDTDNSDSYLRQAYRLFTLHTDGTFVEEATDWLLMMKFEEKNANGGESRLLHLDDWEDLRKFAEHPLAAHEFTYKSPASKNISQTVKRPTFFKMNDKHCICFIDQFVCPETIEQAIYLHDLSLSLENSPATHEMPLPVGDLVMLNNNFWMHGRAPFEKNPGLQRELMRQRGMFSPT